MRESIKISIFWKKNVVLRIGVVVFLLGVLVWGFRMPVDVTIYGQESFDTVRDGWIQSVDGNKVVLEDISNYVSCTTNETIELEHVITEDMVGKSFVFYAEHQEVMITVAGEVIYQLICPEYLQFFSSPGRTWVNIYIEEEMIGETLVLLLKSDFALYHRVPSELYCLSSNEIYSVQMNFLWLRNTVALIVLVLAVLSFINAVLWRQRKMRRYLFAMGDLYFVIGIWICAEVNILAVWLGRGFLSSVIAAIFVRIVPLVLYHLFLSLLSYTSLRISVIGAIAWGNFIGSMLLQFVFGISLIYMQSFHMIIVILMCILIGVEIVCYYRSRKQYHFSDGCVYALIAILIALLLECGIYFYYDANSQWIGVPLAVACIIYALLSHIFLVRAESETSMKKQELEQAYNNLHKKPLNQQINAHFLYNSLNTISAYCKEDPELADKTVLLVAQYMRAYTNLIGASEYVTLSEELELIQNYMDIQNMRFENSIVFNIENTYDDAMIPPLSLQPLVENAVNHGLRNKRYIGEIVIETCRKCDMVEIAVRDNGIGFDVRRLGEAKGVGLENLQTRIEAMGGWMTIRSEVGQGTDVILSVPSNEVEGEL